MIDCRKKFTPVHVWLLAIVFSVVMTECIVGGMEMLLTGKVTFDYFLMGFVASLLVAGLVGGFLNFFLIQQRKIEADLRIAATELETQAGMDVTDTVANGRAGEIPHYVSTLHDIPERKAVEEPIYNDKGHADLKLAIRKLDTLPAMPVIAQRLLALKLDTEEGERMLLVLIEQDPQISAKILGLANSAIVGASRQIKTVRDAAMLLGIKRVQSAATGIAIISLMARTPTGEFNMHDLWLHSFGVAFAMQGIARFMPEEIRPQDDQIFLAGMLHDIGYLALAFIEPILSDKLHNHLSAQPERPSLDVEREILDICHDELGAELAHHWNLPEEIIAVLRYHHSPDVAEATVGQPLVRMANIAEKLLPSFGIIEYVAPGISDEEWKVLGIDPSKAEEVKEQVDKQAEQAIQFASSFT
jgi:HD-like signal output (HDOD) protein